MARIFGRARSGGNEQGFILVVVLWFIAVLALVATTFLTSVRYHVRIAANQMDNAQAQLNADAAVRLVAFRLAAMNQRDLRSGALKVDGSIAECELPGGQPVLISVQDHAGLVDLNAASPELLRKLFMSAGVTPNEATRLANATVDFRDPDDSSRNGGAEAADYQRRGFEAGPKNGFFQTRWELDQVPGMTLDLMETLSERVTVHSRSEGVDPGVLAFDLNLAGGEVRPSRIEAFTIIADAQFGERGRFVRRAIVRLLRQPSAPFQILSWERGLEPLNNQGVARPSEPAFGC